MEHVFFFHPFTFILLIVYVFGLDTSFLNIKTNNKKKQEANKPKYLC